jgi:hypothetical protein
MSQGFFASFSASRKALRCEEVDSQGVKNTLDSFKVYLKGVLINFVR